LSGWTPALSFKMRKIRDPDLLDRLHELQPETFSGKVWRLVRAGRDPLIATSPKGRWDDGSFTVLYTALSPDGARAEIHYHLSRGQPVFPSALPIHLHEIEVEVAQTYAFKSLDALVPYGVNVADYGELDYALLREEYSVTQRIGEAAHFLGIDGLIVPSARWPGANLVVLSDRARLRHVRDEGPQDLKAWARKNGR
jgi:RES domain